MHAVEADAGWIQLLDKEGNEILLNACQGVSRATVDDVLSIKVNESSGERAVVTGEPVVIQQALGIGDDAWANKFARQNRLVDIHRLEALACVPIKSRTQGRTPGKQSLHGHPSQGTRRDRMVGVLGVLNRAAEADTQPTAWGHRGQRAFTAEVVHFLVIVSTMLATAIENILLLQREQEMRREASALLSIARAAGSTLELSEVLERVAAEAARLTGADRCSIWMLSPLRGASGT